MDRYVAELKQVLGGTGLSPDVRARSLAALIEAGAMTRAADKPHSAANTTVGRHGAVAAGGGPDVR